MTDTSTFSAKATRTALNARGFLEQNVIKYCYRPFDVRWLYWEPITNLLDRNRSEYIPHIFAGNLWIEARQKQTKGKFDRGYVTQALGDNMGNGLSNFFPMFVRRGVQSGALFAKDDGRNPNLGDNAIAYTEAYRV